MKIEQIIKREQFEQLPITQQITFLESQIKRTSTELDEVQESIETIAIEEKKSLDVLGFFSATQKRWADLKRLDTQEGVLVDKGKTSLAQLEKLRAAAQQAAAQQAAAQQAAGLAAEPWDSSVGTPAAPKKGVMDSIKAGFGYVGGKVASFCGAIGRGISSAASFVYRAIKAVVNAVVFIVCLPFKAVYAVGSFIGRGIAALFKAGYDGASSAASKYQFPTKESTSSDLVGPTKHIAAPLAPAPLAPAPSAPAPLAPAAR